MLNLESELRSVPKASHVAYLNEYSNCLHNDFCLTIKSLTGTTGEFRESLLQDLRDYKEAADVLLNLYVLGHTETVKMKRLSNVKIESYVALSKKKNL